MVVLHSMSHRVEFCNLLRLYRLKKLILTLRWNFFVEVVTVVVVVAVVVVVIVNNEAVIIVVTVQLSVVYITSTYCFH
jgi:hypothetical protein